MLRREAPLLYPEPRHEAERFQRAHTDPGFLQSGMIAVIAAAVRAATSGTTDVYMSAVKPYRECPDVAEGPRCVRPTLRPRIYAVLGSGLSGRAVEQHENMTTVLSLLP